MTRSTEQAEWQTLSFRMIWVDLLQSLVAMLPAVAAFGVVGMDSGSSAFWALLGLAGFGLLGALADIWRWVFTRYRIGDSLIELHTGLIFRQHRAIRRERIRSVDVEARLRHRLGGLRILKIGAGQQRSAGETALSLNALSTPDALALQVALIDAPADPEPGEDTGLAGQDPEPVAPRQVFASFNPRWAPHNTFSVWAFALALGLGWGGLWLLESFGLNVVGYVSGLLDWGALGWGLSILLAIAVAWLLGCLGLVVNYFTEFWNFELARVPGPEGTQLRTRKGLFTTREVNRDENRFRGMAISEPLLLRWLRVADTRVITTGLDEWAMSDPAAILPRTPVSIARRVANSVLGSALFDTELQPHPGAALRRRLWWATGLSATVAVVLAVLALAGVIGWAWLWAGLLLWALSAAGAVQAYRNLGHRITGKYLITRSGLLNRNTVVLQREAVSTIALRESLLQRRLGLRTVTTMTSAGAGGYDTADLARDDALEFARRAAPGILEPFIIEDP